VKTVAAHAEEKKLALSTHISSDVPDSLVGDELRLRQVLLNLLTNALKFTVQGAVQVTVDVEPERSDAERKMLRFSVIDSGVGVPENKQEAIFEPFKQADGSTTRRFGGTGLGLAICRNIVELMGGVITVQSEAGKGSTFSFTAPFQVAEVIETVGELSIEASTILAVDQDAGSLRRLGDTLGLRPEQAIGSGRSLNILLAEDNEVNRRVATRLLEREGHRITSATDGRKALEMTQQRHFDLVLMDVQMPEMDGPTATGVIRARERAEGRGRTPIVALTANAMSHQVAEYLQCGMDDFVAKPIEAGRLYGVIQAALDKARGSQSGASIAAA
jgi:CheY-like chemotaxis protein